MINKMCDFLIKNKFSTRKKLEKMTNDEFFKKYADSAMTIYKALDDLSDISKDIKKLWKEKKWSKK